MPWDSSLVPIEKKFDFRLCLAQHMLCCCMQARETGQLNVMDLCHQWLANKMQPGAP